MPPLTLMVLDALADDRESIESMRDHGEVASYGLALVDKGLIVDAVRSLISDRLIEVADVAEDPVELVPVLPARTDDASLHRYSFGHGKLAGRSGGRVTTSSMRTGTPPPAGRR